MNPTQPLLTLLAHVERERDAAMAEAKRVELEHRKALRQAEQLLGYRRDYEQRWSSQFGGDGGGIDIERSVSRVMNSVVPAAHAEAARRFRQLHSKHAKASDLIQLGAYAPGHDAELDTAVRLHPAMTALLEQDMHLPAKLDESLQRLRAVLSA